LRQAWEQAGFDPAVMRKAENHPQISFGNWVGGDRDGHPLVTSEITEHTLKFFRLYALKLVANLLDETSKKVSVYCTTKHLSKPFVLRLNELEKENPDFNHSDNEPFSKYILLLKHKLPIIERSSGNIELNDTEKSYKSSKALSADINLLHDALVAFGASSIADYDIQKVLRHLTVFGFHLTHVDIRQNSAYYEEALFDIIKTSLPVTHNKLQDDRTEFEAFILKELNNNRPFINRIAYLESEKSQEAVRTFNMLSKYIHRYSERAVGSLIVSMTRNAYDLFMVYLFVRESGLSHYSPNGLVSPLPVVPLF
jgi:phosphoenolpyruvate carboxylase